MKEDVLGFKKGLAAIMQKHHIASFKGFRGSFIGYWGGSESNFVMYCNFVPSVLRVKPFNEIFEVPEYNLRQMTDDLRGLFDYYNVRHVSNQYLKRFEIAFDDNNEFVLRDLNIEFFDQKVVEKKHD